MKKKVFQRRSIMRLYLLMCLLFPFGGAGVLSAQVNTPTNLMVSGNTITFDVSWNNRSGQWSDTAWVFVDYYDVNTQQMKRLPVATATATGTGSSTSYTAATGPYQGFYLIGNARTANSFSATVQITADASVGGSVVRPCVYVSDFPPVREYSAAGVSFKGTKPFVVKITDGSSVTWPYDTPMPIEPGKDVDSFTDATGNPGVLLCSPSITPVINSLTASSSLVCSGASPTLTASVQANADGNLTYIWSSVNGSVNNPNGASTQAVNGIAASDTYTLQVRNTMGCSALSVVAINVHPQAAKPVFTSTKHANDCASSTTDISVVLTVESADAVQYKWFRKGAEDTEAILVATTTTPTYTATQSGAFDYTVIGVNVCGQESVVSDEFDVTINLEGCLDRVCGDFNPGIIGSAECAEFNAGRIGQ